MILRITAFFGVAMLLLLASTLATPTTFAKGVEYQTVILDTSGLEVGEAQLTRKKGKIKIKAKIDGLNGGHVFSVWGKVNSGPSFNLTGFFTDDDGEGKIRGNVKVDKNLDLFQFDIIIKDHGVPLQGKGEIKRQKSTKHYGCPPPTCPEVAMGTFVIS